MWLESSAFPDGGAIPTQYTCDGAGVSPELRWGDVPAGVYELALLCEDPDAPSGTFVHWVTWGIDARTTLIPEGGPVKGMEGRNGFGKLGWGGPCPPRGHGPHRYVFSLYALEHALTLPEGSTVSDVRDRMRGNVLAECAVTGTYERR